MLLRIVPLLAVVLTLIALLSSAALRPYQHDGLNAPAMMCPGFSGVDCEIG